jgi:arginine deiminase
MSPLTREDLYAATTWRQHPGQAGYQRKRLGFIEDYLFIGGDLLSARQAARRLGVSDRTVVRYRAFLRSLGAS